ncbi:type I polyketide synthase [Actinokineospora auranticolor]|uniref:Acyl transferase domain-containing protein n=1 Tax=Actinokineospora auranticolor TaxID=155976 RepID=A0A2S6GJR0_9PSEU|nr:type I polyketide synthase [Actinokineospora auranticolor]PPK65445.1 acyl transferase domain-containing protein [Actinokineospora auranticolor]
MSERTPIAIVGVACRLPGASTVDEFWTLLGEGRDEVTEIPRDRPDHIDIDALHDPTPARPGRIVSRCGGFLTGIDRFDAAFFGLSAHAATRLDPQQRLLMQTTWEALEDAGVPAESLAGSNTAVYTSCPPAGYWDLLRAMDQRDIHAALTADSGAGVAGLISHHLDLRGPNMSVTAMCASSMLATHLACRALRDGDADLAVVGSANLLITPDIYLALSEAEMLSPTGRCRFGDADADGYVRSEAVIAMVLKPLPRAQADGDRVLATILGTAVSSDGRTGGTMMATGVGGHERMLRAAYRDAGVDPSEVDYVEGHGSGTAAGDPIELTALANVLGPGRPADRPLLVGSVKSNLGHTEFAAGMTGLLKAALAVRHREIPRTLHVRRRNPVLDELPAVELATAARPWPAGHGPAIAGASSFGLTGTNVHVVVSAPPAPVVEPAAPAVGPYVIPLSAQGPQALADLAGKYADLLLEDGDTAGDLRDIAFSAGTRRTHFPSRAAVVGTDRRRMAGALRAFAAGGHPAAVVSVTERVSVRPDVVFVFPGQGGQWAGMGADLMAVDETFAAALRECDAAIRDEAGWSVVDLLGSATDLSEVDRIQPAVWAVQVALARVWLAWGITPDLVIGHSMGEVAAAVTTGALSVRDGAAVICRRSALVAGESGPGAMWLVRIGEEEAAAAIGDRVDEVSVGVVNSDTTVVLSGEPTAVAAVVAPLRAAGVFCRRVPVDYASHSPQVDPLLSGLVAELATLRPVAGTAPIHSTAYDRVVDGSGLDAHYWADNLRMPVHFAAAVRSALAGRGRVVFVEIGPHPLLAGAISETADILGADAVVLASMERDGVGQEELRTSLATAYAYGRDPDWAALYPGGRYVPLPSYPWQTRGYWVEPAAAPPLPVAPVRAVPRAQAPPALIDPRRDARIDPGLGVRIDLPRTRPAIALTLARHTAEVLATDPDDLDHDLPLPLAGMDSVLAAKLQARLRADLGLQIPVHQFLGTRCLRDVLAYAHAALEPAA